MNKIRKLTIVLFAAVICSGAIANDHSQEGAAETNAFWEQMLSHFGIESVDARGGRVKTAGPGRPEGQFLSDLY